MSAMRDMPVSEILERVEAAAARGQRGAEWTLERLLREELLTGELSMISRLAAKTYCAGAAQTHERTEGRT
jgi:hypothetical protein